MDFIHVHHPIRRNCFSNLQESYRGTFYKSMGCQEKGWWFQQAQGRVRWGIRELVRVEWLWHREAVAGTLDMFKARLDGAWGNLG